MNLLTVIPLHNGDTINAEALLDFIAAQRGKQPRGACLLVCFPDVHPEAQTKLRISAEIAFESVEVLPLSWQKVPQMAKNEAINQLWHQAALHIAQSYRTPFVVLEPDTVPLKADWCEVLAAAYEANHKRYMGAFLKGGDERLFLSRTAIYPPGAIADIGKWCLETQQPLVYASKAPFEIIAGDELVKRASKTKLIQSIRYDANTDRSKVREDAVLLHSDKEGVLLSLLRDELKVKADTKTSPFLIDPMPNVSQRISIGDVIKHVSDEALKEVVKRGPGRPKKEPVNA